MIFILKKLNYRYDDKLQYSIPLDCPSIEESADCIIDYILHNDKRSLSEIIEDETESCIDIYTADLVKNCCSVGFLDVINSSIKEFGNTKTIEQLYHQSEYYYYYTTLSENINTICQNALLEYISSKTINITGKENDVNMVFDLLKSNIEDYISNLETDTSITANTIIDNFDVFMLNTIKELEENINHKNITTDDDDNQFMGAKLINDEFNFEAEPEQIKIDVSAPVGVLCNDFCL